MRYNRRIVQAFSIGFLCTAVCFLGVIQIVRADEQQGTIDIQFQVTNGGAVCGDGVVDIGEDCDEGGSNGVCPATCSASCTINDCEDDVGGGGGTTPNVNITETVPSYYSTELEWTASGGNITGCIISYDTDGAPYTFSTTTYTVDGITFSTLLEGLSADTTYFVQVVCTNTEGNNGIDTAVIITEVPPPMVLQTVTIQATPEMRVIREDKPNGNLDTDFHVFIFDAGEQNLLATVTESTNGQGEYTGEHELPVATDLVAVYKSNSHLAKKIVGVTLNGVSSTLDFTAGDTFDLLAGDVSPEHDAYQYVQDNTVNLLDLTYVTADGIYNVNNTIADLNRDDVVSILDVTLLLKNYNLNGDVVPLIL